MKNSVLVAACGCACVVFASETSARTWVIPHVLETSGSVAYGGGVGSFDTQMFANVSLDEIGPGENGEFSYLYSSPILFSGSDSFSRSFTVSLDVFFAQTRPEGNGFRTEFIIGTSLTEFNGNPFSAPGGLWELSVFGFDPQPIEGGLIFATPATSFVVEDDGSGRRISVDMHPSELRLAPVPSPWAAPFLAVASLLGLRKRRD